MGVWVGAWVRSMLDQYSLRIHTRKRTATSGRAGKGSIEHKKPKDRK